MPFDKGLERTCEQCEFYEHRNNTMICLVYRLRLAFHKLLTEIPIVNKFVDGDKICDWFLEKE